MSVRRICIAVAAAASLVVAAPAGGAAPRVKQMVVFKNDFAKFGTVSASATRVKIGRKRCAVGAGTPLAALVRGKPGTLRLADFGSCSSRARDAGGLYVRGIGSNVVSGPEDPDGWVYKVGNKAAPAGAADPSGPFGRGLLRSGQRVTWFWCVSLQDEEGCQRTLELKVTGKSSGTVNVRVRGYDNSGKGVDVEGATVAASRIRVRTGPDGTATIATGPGTHFLVARKEGLVRSYPVGVVVP